MAKRRFKFFLFVGEVEVSSALYHSSGATPPAETTRWKAFEAAESDNEGFRIYTPFVNQQFLVRFLGNGPYNYSFMFPIHEIDEFPIQWAFVEDIFARLSREVI